MGGKEKMGWETSIINSEENNMEEERELKYLLPMDSFYNVVELIQKTFPDITTKEKLQINYYYDTDQYDLLRAGITCRVRQSGAELLGQYKERSVDDVHRSQETEFQLCQLPLIIEKNGQTMFYQGQLATHRKSYKISNAVKIECDVNMYLGNCDYEIEIEDSEEAYDWAKQIAEKLLLTNINLVNKYERFMKAKQLHLSTVNKQ